MTIKLGKLSPELEARKKAMDLLARREHGCAELEKKLIVAGFDADVAADAVHQLREEGLQSDRRFAESFVQSRINQGKGPLRIHADLGERGIRSALIDEVIEETGQDWYSLARDTRRKKFGTGVPAEFKEKARQMRFLQYRGFGPDHIRAAVSDSED
jgi:regulatory protein